MGSRSGYKDVIFELDAKWVVDAFNLNKIVIFEFGALLGSYKSLFSFFKCYNSHVEFARRGANRVAHSQAGVTLLPASPHEHFKIPTCISRLIINEIH